MRWVRAASSRTGIVLVFSALAIGATFGCSGGKDAHGASNAAAVEGEGPDDALDIEDALCDPSAGVDCNDPSLTMSMDEFKADAVDAGVDWGELAAVDPDPAQPPAGDKPADTAAANLGAVLGAADNVPGSDPPAVTLRFWLAPKEVDAMAALGSAWANDAAARAGCLEDLGAVMQADFQAFRAGNPITQAARQWMDAFTNLGGGVGQSNAAFASELFSQIVQRPVRIHLAAEVYYPRAYIHSTAYALAVNLLANWPVKCRYYEVGPVRRAIRDRVRGVIVRRMEHGVGIAANLVNEAIAGILDPAMLNQQAGAAAAQAAGLAQLTGLKTASGENALDLQFDVNFYDYNQALAESQLELWLPGTTEPFFGPLQWHTITSYAEAAAAVYRKLKDTFDPPADMNGTNGGGTNVPGDDATP